MKNTKIGIFGGTFNPIHNGHLLLASQAQDVFALDRVVFVPSSVPPHKEIQDLAGAGERYRMTELGVKSNPGFSVSKVELERGGRSYSVETANQFKKEYGKKAKIYFIIGMDMMNDLDTWKDVDNLLEKVEFIVGTRPGYSQDVPIRKGCHLFRFPGFEFSSTEIRERIREGRSIKYMVPEAVERYIVSAGLYGR